jgi:hypothetical protein
MNRPEEHSIGSTGFSQFGTPDYYEKQKFEGQWLLNWLKNNFELHPFVWVKWKRQPYEGNSYHEIVACFYEDQNRTEEEIDAIWQCINSLEEIDFDTLEEQVNWAWSELNCKIIPIRKVA